MSWSDNIIKEKYRQVLYVWTFKFQTFKDVNVCASPCTSAVVLYFTVLFKTKNVFFIFCVCFLCSYYLCEKYYKPIIVKYYIVDCVSWVPRRPLLDLWTNWNYKENGLTNALLEPNSFICRGFTVIAKNCGIYITETRAIFSCVGGGRNYSSTRCLDYWWEC